MPLLVQIIFVDLKVRYKCSMDAYLRFRLIYSNGSLQNRFDNPGCMKEINGGKHMTAERYFAKKISSVIFNFIVK